VLLRRTAIAATLTPFAVAACVALWLSGPDQLSPTGDEPHYLVMADSVVHDRTLDLRSAYGREDRTRRIYRTRLNPHVLIVNHRWGGYHQPGLALLLALPFGIDGVVGARLALGLVAGLLGWAVYCWLIARHSDRVSAWLAVGLTLSLPIGFGASQIYPDLPAGVFVLALTLWLLRQTSGGASRMAWAVFWTATGLLPWLNAKFLVTTIVLAGGAACAIWYRGRERERPSARDVCAAGALLIAGPAALAAYHVWAFATPFGLRHLAEVGAPPARALMMFLGLHFDQGQGMFLQHPFLLGGVAALVPFVRLRPRLALFWVALYASLIVPNSFELARYGGGGPAGRFGWSAEWLWIIPLAVVLAQHRRQAERYIETVVTACLVYQVMLAMWWIPEPLMLFTNLGDHIELRNSLFPVVARRALPSFYFWDFRGYLTYGPNAAAFLVCGTLLATGVVLDRYGMAAARSIERRPVAMHPGV
jgi:hypothetical protein